MPNFFVPAWRWQLLQARLLPAKRLEGSATSGPIWAWVAVMRSRPRRTSRPWVLFGSAPISGTVQIGGLDFASCAELVGIPRPSGHPNSHKDASATIRVTRRERTQARNISNRLPPTSVGGAPTHAAFYHGRPRGFCSRIVLVG